MVGSTSEIRPSQVVTIRFLLGTDGMPHPVGGVIGVTCTCHALINNTQLGEFCEGEPGYSKVEIQ